MKAFNLLLPSSLPRSRPICKEANEKKKLLFSCQSSAAVVPDLYVSSYHVQTVCPEEVHHGPDLTLALSDKT